jgi:hypothetical protein
MNSNSIEQKWHAIWYRIYWEFPSNYGVGGKKHLGETQIWKNSFPSLFTWELTKQIVVWNYPKDVLFNWMIYKILSCLIEISFNASLSLDFFSKWYKTYVCTCNIWLSNLIFHVHFQRTSQKQLWRLWNLLT